MSVAYATDYEAEAPAPDWFPDEMPDFAPEYEPRPIFYHDLPKRAAHPRRNLHAKWNSPPKPVLQLVPLCETPKVAPRPRLYLVTDEEPAREIAGGIDLLEFCIVGMGTALTMIEREASPVSVEVHLRRTWLELQRMLAIENRRIR